MTTDQLSEPDLPDDAEETPSTAPIHEPTVWRDDGWMAQVVRNEDDEGWAVQMYLGDEAEPALVGPWTMGRDKKNPKPLDGNAFRVLVKTASEVLLRHKQQLQAQLHKSIVVTADGQRIKVTLDIVPDEDDPSATLSAHDASGELLAEVRARPNFRLNETSANAWIASDYAEPR